MRSVQNYFLGLVKVNNHTVTISPPLYITKFNSQINIGIFWHQEVGVIRKIG